MVFQNHTNKILMTLHSVLTLADQIQNTHTHYREPSSCSFESESGRSAPPPSSSRIRDQYWYFCTSQASKLSRLNPLRYYTHYHELSSCSFESDRFRSPPPIVSPSSLLPSCSLDFSEAESDSRNSSPTRPSLKPAPRKVPLARGGTFRGFR